MIVYARTKDVVIQGKDSEGNDKYIQVTGEEQDTLKTESLDNLQTLRGVYTELKKLNLYISTIVDEKIHEGDFIEAEET